MKPVIPSTYCLLPFLKPRKTPNEEIQIDFGGPVYDEKTEKSFLVACVNRFSILLSEEVYKHAKANNAQKTIQGHILIHGVPRRIRPANRQIGKQISNFCEQNNFGAIPAPINDQIRKKLSYQQIAKIKFLGHDTVQGTTVTPEGKWEDQDRSDAEV